MRNQSLVLIGVLRFQAVELFFYSTKNYLRKGWGEDNIYLGYFVFHSDPMS